MNITDNLAIDNLGRSDRRAPDRSFRRFPRAIALIISAKILAACGPSFRSLMMTYPMTEWSAHCEAGSLEEESEALMKRARYEIERMRTLYRSANPELALQNAENALTLGVAALQKLHKTSMLRAAAPEGQYQSDKPPLILRPSERAALESRIEVIDAEIDRWITEISEIESAAAAAQRASVTRAQRTAAR